MTKAIRKKTKLPFKPTDKPSPQQVMITAQMAISSVQTMIHSPAAVLTCLMAAQKVYLANLKEKGFQDEDAIKACEDLATVISADMLEMNRARETGEAPKIVAPDRSLVDLDGNPLT